MKSWTIRTIVVALLLAAAVALPQPARAQEARKVVNRVSPVFPPLAKKMNVAGVVKIEATISAAGTVASTKVIGGHPLLAQAAVDALNKWKYEAAGETTTTVVEFRFNNGNN